MAIRIWCHTRPQGFCSDGPGPADFVVVAGDSSGGSHTLSLLAWIRDQALRAPDAAVAFSRSTESMITGLGRTGWFHRGAADLAGHGSCLAPVTRLLPEAKEAFEAIGEFLERVERDQR